jgi:hypothetical protein
MTAGHNALRGSGSGQKPAFENAMAQVGCPDRRGRAPQFDGEFGPRDIDTPVSQAGDELTKV